MSDTPGGESLAFLTIHEARDMLDSGQVTSEELTGAALAQIDRYEGEVHAFVSLTPERALESAREFDRRRAAGEVPRSPLDGIPMSLKDVLITRGVTTTCGSRHLENFVPPFDGTVPARLMQAGAVLLGKNNCDEFAMGSSTENSAWGVSRNPWDTARVPGGSSGGSAAAVAAGMGLYSLGTDTGGSVRQPASLCGLVGLKPTYGRVSRYGLVAFASSLDQIGPFTRDALDAAIVLEAIAGQDPCDSTSQPVEVPGYSAILREGGQSLQGTRLGVRRGAFDGAGSSEGGLNAEVAAAVQEAVRQLAELGAEVREIDLPSLDYALAAYYIIAPAEASSNLARYDGMKYGYRDADARNSVNSMLATREFGFGPEVKRRIMLGTYALSAGYYEAFYKKAQQVRTLVAQDFKRAFEDVDAIIDPTSPTVAFRIGEKLDDPLAMYLTDIYTVPANLAGVPGVSVPCGFSEGLPIGMQVLGRHFDEATILRVAHAYQQVTDWHRQTPGMA
ncbi:MAG TPA: Asp-tRNA(Asn)/Glu-tRNA(Gln) amidotransferase subunit GatA [Chloroflexia bacterium]|nr:Asp-tRNA(Asn)/Glu-tRNA(Gln) amidotransferase subunit GatA [Chloroflexia bacterium]